MLRVNNTKTPLNGLRDGLLLFAWHLTVFLSVAFSATAATQTEEIQRAVNAIVATLPVGWAVATQSSGEIPFGHHWNEDYTGPRGNLLVLRGTRPVNAEFRDASNQWHAVHVATEGLKVWLMPSNYSNSRFPWLSFERPANQPNTIIDHGPVKVYATPWPVLLSEKDFYATSSRSRGIRWPDYLPDSPDYVTWKDWQAKLRKALEKSSGK